MIAARAENKGENTMKQTTTWGLKTALALGMCVFGGLAIVGCQNTAEGAKEDTAKNGAAMQNAADKAADNTKMAADNAAEATKSGAMNAGDALTLTPKVKNAIVADAKLNDTKNLINVNTKDGVVHLEGHVMNNEQKKLAGDIATKAVKDAGSSDKVMNMLTVESH